MRTFRLCAVSVGLAMLFLFTASPLILAANKTVKIPPPVDERILITAVNTKASTITIKYMRNAKAPNHTYMIDGLTVLTVNDVPGKITDIKTGMQLRSYVERDGSTLDSVSISMADPAPVDPNEKK